MILALIPEHMPPPACFTATAPALPVPRHVAYLALRAHLADPFMPLAEYPPALYALATQDIELEDLHGNDVIWPSLHDLRALELAEAYRFSEDVARYGRTRGIARLRKRLGLEAHEIEHLSPIFTLSRAIVQQTYSLPIEEARAWMQMRIEHELGKIEKNSDRGQLMPAEGHRLKLTSLRLLSKVQGLDGREDDGGMEDMIDVVGTETSKDPLALKGHDHDPQ